MINLTQGKTLGPGDLGLVVRDSQGALVDPASIAYSIFHVEGSDQTLATQPKSIPARASQATFYVPLTVPSVWDGAYRLIWYLKQYPTSDEALVYEDFQVVGVNPASTSLEAPSVVLAPKPNSKAKYAPAIMYVRELLSDENPDRNYHFRPPTPGKVIAEMNSRVGFIWTDDTILRMLDVSLAQMNVWNPKTYYNWTLDSVPSDWGKIAALGAAAKCLSKEGARWIAEQFDYSLNGISLSLNKASEYQSLAESYKQEFTESTEMITKCRPFSAGLRQQRWLLG